MSSVTLRGISKSYGAQRVLDDVDLEVPHGSITSVLGASGCGKTTLLRIVAGFVTADSGTVDLDDRRVVGPGISESPDRRGVGYVPQEGALFPHLDVAANIGFGLPRRQRTAAKLKEMLDLAELPSQVSGRYPHELSGGQQQRVAIARALAPAPSVILLDEPFSSLDAALRISAGREVSRVLRHAGATALLVTHDQGEALSLADQVALMRAGRVVQVDTPSRLYEAPVDAEAAEFVGGATVLSAVARRGVAPTPLGHLTISGTTEGPVQLLIRPEQVEIGQPDSPAKATVTEVSFYGAHVLLRLLLPDGEVLTARSRSTRTPAVDDVVGVSVNGPVVGHTDPRAGQA